VSLHNRRRIRVRNRRREAGKSFATWIQGQDTRIEAADHYLSLDECKALAASRLGQFINRGSGFIRFDTCIPKDTKTYQNGKPSTLSRKIDAPVMHRYAEAVNANDDPLVILAVEGWA
jgi:hypothetical protein